MQPSEDANPNLFLSSNHLCTGGFIHTLEELDQFCMAFKFQRAHPFSLPKMYYGAVPKFEPCVKTDGDGRQSQKHVLP